MAMGINDPGRDNAGFILASNREEGRGGEVAGSNTVVNPTIMNANYVLVIGLSP